MSSRLVHFTVGKTDSGRPTHMNIVSFGRPPMSICAVGILIPAKRGCA